MLTPVTKPAWVLVVNDDASERIKLFRRLEAAGHHATVVDVRSALDLLRAEPFDLVLLAPSHGGDVLRAMENDERLSRTPVVVLSADDDYERVLGSSVALERLGQLTPSGDP